MVQREFPIMFHGIAVQMKQSVHWENLLNHLTSMDLDIEQGLPKSLDDTEVITSMMRLRSNLPVEFYAGSFKGRPYVHTEPLPSGKETPQAIFMTSSGILDIAMGEVESQIMEACSDNPLEEVLSEFLVIPPEFSKMKNLKA